MKTEIQIEGNRFLINDKPTYEGRTYKGQPIEGLLFNSRMVQAIFDDENPETAGQWRYPDSGIWDPERNTDEFCAMLPEYRRHGLLGVTVGLQGGGSVYEPEVYNHYINSAFLPDGGLKPAYFNRLQRVLEAADEAGMVVIVNYFYWRQVGKMEGNSALRKATEEATQWLLSSGFRNILVDVMNEFQAGEGLLRSSGIDALIEIVQKQHLDGRRLPASSSIHPENLLPPGRWQELQDFYLPHGNSFWADELREQLQRIKSSLGYRKKPRPLLVNEDSIYVESLEAALAEYASWGYYSQGYGAGGSWLHGRFNWQEHGREENFSELSGYQTVPVNWGLNTGEKRAFFERLAEVTGSDAVPHSES